MINKTTKAKPNTIINSVQSASLALPGFLGLLLRALSMMMVGNKPLPCLLPMREGNDLLYSIQYNLGSLDHTPLPTPFTQPMRRFNNLFLGRSAQVRDGEAAVERKDTDSVVGNGDLTELLGKGFAELNHGSGLMGREDLGET
jgi:hypothetical protein